MQFFKQTVRFLKMAWTFMVAAPAEDRAKATRLFAAGPKHSFKERGRTFNEPDAR